MTRDLQMLTHGTLTKAVGLLFAIALAAIANAAETVNIKVDFNNQT